MVDEIGKMEMFSGAFQKAVTTLLNDKTVMLLATIPVVGANPIPFVEEIRRHPQVRLFQVIIFYLINHLYNVYLLPKVKIL